MGVFHHEIEEDAIILQGGEGCSSLADIDDAGLKTLTLLEPKDFADMLGPRVLHGELVLCRKGLKKDDIHTSEYSIGTGFEGRVRT